MSIATRSDSVVNGTNAWLAFNVQKQSLDILAINVATSTVHQHVLLLHSAIMCATRSHLAEATGAKQTKNLSKTNHIRLLDSVVPWAPLESSRSGCRDRRCVCPPSFKQLRGIASKGNISVRLRVRRELGQYTFTCQEGSIERDIWRHEHQKRAHFSICTVFSNQHKFCDDGVLALNWVPTFFRRAKGR